MTGLTSSVAQSRLKEYGLNKLVAKSEHTWIKMIAGQFTDLLVLILIGAAGVSYAFGEVTDAIVLLVIIVLNAGIGFFQEFRTERTLKALQKMVHADIRVLRDGQEVLLNVEFIVPGDIVILGEGDKIPADGILLESNILKADEAALTGESVPVTKKVDDDVFMGTSVVYGSGKMEVQQTGMETRFGHIAKLTSEVDKTKSPLQKELAHIGIFVTKVTVVISLFLFFVGLWRESSVLESLLFSVSVAIAAVPEGLPTTITVALALGAATLARRKSIMKRLSSVETLGSVTTICSDKTGTLTKNEMTVREMYLADGSLWQVTGVGYNPLRGKIQVFDSSDSKTSKNLLEYLYRVCVLCTEATLVKKRSKYSVLGDPTEGALLTLAAKAGFTSKEKVRTIFPFDSDRKMMSVVTKNEILVKGSPDQLLQHCTHWTDGVKKHILTPQKRQTILKQYQKMGENALRVLAFAFRPVEKNLPKDQGAAEKNLVFVGLVGMIDPPRSEVEAMVGKCHTAGIRIIVITGDYGVTAEAIARELGIVEGENVEVITGDVLRKISEAKLSKMLKDREKSFIFARNMPDQKMRIVKALKQQGEVVAMTGDGVNDAPALKKADIGIAMGITGTEVSKEAATMILTDDSFSSIVNAVEEGRRIYDNLKKFMWFIFACNIGELVTIFLAILFQFPLPLTAILILCVDLGTDILPAVALGVDHKAPDVMERAPRSPKSKVLQGKFVKDFLLVGSVIGLSVTGAFLFTLMQDGWAWGLGVDYHFAHATSVSFASLVFVQLVNAFSARSTIRSIFDMKHRENYFLILSVMSSVLLVLLILYVPFLNRVLGTTPLGMMDWYVVAIASLIPLVFIEMQKYFRRRNLLTA